MKVVTAESHLTIDEAAALKGVSHTEIRRWLKSRWITSERHFHRVMLNREEVLAFTPPLPGRRRK